MKVKDLKISPRIIQHLMECRNESEETVMETDFSVIASEFSIMQAKMTKSTLRRYIDLCEEHGEPIQL